MDGWISVKDRLPEEWISVIIHMPDVRPFPEVREGWLCPNGRFYCPMFWDEVEVDYWMPLPELKEETTGEKEGNDD